MAHKIYGGRRKRLGKNTINYKNWQSRLYSKYRAVEMKRKWKNPKAGLRRKRYYTNRQ